MSDIYKRIEDLCEERGITITEMCRHINVNRGNLSDLKMGRQKGLSAVNLDKIASFFRVPAGYLLGTVTGNDGMHFSDGSGFGGGDGAGAGFGDGTGYGRGNSFGMRSSYGIGDDRRYFRETDISNIKNHVYNVVQFVEFKVVGTITAGYNGEAVEELTGETEYLPLQELHGENPDNFFILNVSGNSMYPQIQDGDKVLVYRTSSVDSGSIAAILFEGENATLKRVNYIYGEDWLELIPANPEYMTKRIEGADLELCRVLGKVVKAVRDFE